MTTDIFSSKLPTKQTPYFWMPDEQKILLRSHLNKASFRLSR